MKYGPKKDKGPLARIQRFAHRQELREKQKQTDGKRYKYQNNTTGDLSLPKPAEDGRTAIGKKGEFIGDGYFLCMVPQCLIIVEDLNMANQSKLITEQPPTVTTQGKVEYVQQSNTQKLNESNPGKKEEILLTEDPVGGVVIIE